MEISTDVYPGVAFEGTIDNIASKADEAHTYPVEIVVEVQPAPAQGGIVRTH